MARKTILVCDDCGTEVEEGRGESCASRSTTPAAARRLPISATAAPARCPGTRWRGGVGSRRLLSRAHQRRSGAGEPLASPPYWVPAVGHLAAILRCVKEEPERPGLRWADGSLACGWSGTCLRSRFCSTGSSPPSIVIPGSSSRPRRRRSGRARAGRPGRSVLAGTVGTFDTLFAFLAGVVPSATSAMPSATSCSDTSSPQRRRARSGLGALCRFRRSLQAPSPRSRPAFSIPRILARTGRATRAYRAARGLAVRDRGMVRRRAVERLTASSALGTVLPCSPTASRT